jgi:hypothetical protein
VASAVNPQGYSGTPLATKLGLKPGHRVLLADAPAELPTLLQPLPEGLQFVTSLRGKVDVVHAFFTRRQDLAPALTRYRDRLVPDAVLWVSWPKKASKRPTDITEDVIRELALPLGWVDVKVCAVDAVWSGLKLVVRKELR